VTLPLFERYPGTAVLPLAGIALLPTPITPLHDDNVHALHIKRDDLSSTVYGGNKVRKLDFLLGTALAAGRKAVVTFGAYGSNHALATAVHARQLGLEPHVILSPQEPGPYAAATLRAHAGLDTQIHLVDGWDGDEKAAEVVAELTARDGIAPLVIPMGGTGTLGCAAYVNAALELLDQAEIPSRIEEFIDPEDGEVWTVETHEPDVFYGADVVYVAAGTLGTAVGLAIGFAAAEVTTRVEAVRVTPEEVANLDVARALTEETVAMLTGLDPDFPPVTFDDLALNLRSDFFEPGYGIPTPETLAAVQMAAGAGLTLETTYTGKAIAALMADTDAGLLEDEHVVFWDTYNSAPLPAPGPDTALPLPLQLYLEECDRLFG
jgi:D-cysteine desulfhydrase